MSVVREILKFYIPTLVLTIIGMFSLHAEDLTKGKALVILGLYALFSLAVLSSLVFISVMYLAKSRELARATTLLHLLVHSLPLSYMLITQTADLLVVSGLLVSLLYSLFVVLDRWWT